MSNEQIEYLRELIKKRNEMFPENKMKIDPISVDVDQAIETIEEELRTGIPSR